MRSYILFALAALTSSGLMAKDLQGVFGSLVYSDDGLGSLVYKSSAGDVFEVFDEGLSFNYDGRYGSGDLSPDKSFSIVNFSEVGVGEDGLSKKYLCAFVRMSDGCVVDVSVGEQCGGSWGGASQWNSSLSNGYDFTKDAPTIDKVYNDYASGRKDLIQVSSPRVLAYFLEGTAFDNILACDPPRDVNKETYLDMLELLARDGDTINFSKLKTAMNKAGMLPKNTALSARVDISGWTQKSIVSERAYLYMSPSSLGVTKAYLIRGDVVAIYLKSINSFVEVRYQQKGGRLIEKWMRCQDVDFCEPKENLEVQ